MDSFEEIEVYVAIGDYVAQEDCNISLRCGQQVQVCVRACVCVSGMYACVFTCMCLYVYDYVSVSGMGN